MSVTAQARVDRTAARLDLTRPGWWWQIDAGRLDIGSGTDCLGEQLRWGLGLETDLDTAGLYAFRRADQVRLTEAWVLAIKARFEHGVDDAYDRNEISGAAYRRVSGLSTVDVAPRP